MDDFNTDAEPEEEFTDPTEFCPTPEDCEAAISWGLIDWDVLARSIKIIRHYGWTQQSAFDSVVSHFEREFKRRLWHELNRPVNK